MARSLFAGRPGDSVASIFSIGTRQIFTLPVDANGDPASVALTVWDEPDGTQLTDLVAADGTTPITQVVVPAATGQIPEFYGPDGFNVSVYLRDTDGDYQRLDARADDFAEQVAADADRAEIAAASVQRDEPGGVAPLDGDARVPQVNLPEHLEPAELSASYVPVITPEKYIAQGLSVTAAVRAAFDEANATRVVGIGANIWHPGATVFLRPGETYELAGLVEPILVSCNVDGAGATLVAPGGYDDTVLLVGHEDDGNNLQSASLRLPNVTGTAPSEPVAGSVGITFQNVWACDVSCGRTIFFETGLRFTGKGMMGTVYNRVFPGWVDFCKVGWRFDSGSDGTGWANQNTFTAGEISQSPAWGLDRREAGWRHVVMDGGTGWTVHGNTFTGCSFEGNLSEIYFDLHNASDNQWVGATRFEQGDLGRPVLMGADLLTAPDAGIYINSHGLTVGDMVCFNANTYPPGMEAGVAYRVETTASDSFSVTPYPSGSTVIFEPGGVDVKLLRPPRIVADNSDGNTYGNKVHDGYNSWPGPLELVVVGTTPSPPKTGLEF